MYVEIVGWDDDRREVEFDWMGVYCEDGCMNYGLDDGEVRYIVEFESNPNGNIQSYLYTD